MLIIVVDTPYMPLWQVTQKALKLLMLPTCPVQCSLFGRMEGKKGTAHIYTIQGRFYKPVYCLILPFSLSQLPAGIIK